MRVVAGEMAHAAFTWKVEMVSGTISTFRRDREWGWCGVDVSRCDADHPRRCAPRAMPAPMIVAAFVVAAALIVDLSAFCNHWRGVAREGHSIDRSSVR
jgi:hypothetical protein